MTKDLSIFYSNTLGKDWILNWVRLGSIRWKDCYILYLFSWIEVNQLNRMIQFFWIWDASLMTIAWAPQHSNDSYDSPQKILKANYRMQCVAHIYARSLFCNIWHRISQGEFLSAKSGVKIVHLEGEANTPATTQDS